VLAAPYTGVKQRGMRAMIALERQSVRRRLRKSHDRLRPLSEWTNP
jgi:coniferyl-aldehyde dehydrogenase